MSWRPEKGWKNLYDGQRQSHPLRVGMLRQEISDFEIYEAGADAILEALKAKSPLMTPEQMRLLAPDRKYPYGWLVFIEEE